MIRLLTRVTLFVAFVIACLAPAGCGPGENGRYPVEGSVTLNGVPLVLGTIEFEPIEEKAIKAGGPVEDGKYSIPARFGPVPGQYKVRIWWHRKTGRMVIRDGEEVEEYLRIAPEEYNAKTTLTADVKASKNVIDFEVTGPAQHPPLVK